MGSLGKPPALPSSNSNDIDTNPLIPALVKIEAKRILFIPQI